MYRHFLDLLWWALMKPCLSCTLSCASWCWWLVLNCWGLLIVIFFIKKMLVWIFWRVLTVHVFRSFITWGYKSQMGCSFAIFRLFPLHLHESPALSHRRLRLHATILLHPWHHNAWLFSESIITLAIIRRSVDGRAHWTHIWLIDRALMLHHRSTCINIERIISAQWRTHVLWLIAHLTSTRHHRVFYTRVERPHWRTADGRLWDEALLMHQLRRIRSMSSMVHWVYGTWCFVATGMSLLLLIGHPLRILGVTMLINRVWVATRIDVILILHVPLVVAVVHLVLASRHSMSLVCHWISLLTILMWHVMACPELTVVEILLLADFLSLLKMCSIVIHFLVLTFPRFTLLTLLILF